MGKTGPVGAQGTPGKSGPQGFRGIPGPAVSHLSIRTLTSKLNWLTLWIYICFSGGAGCKWTPGTNRTSRANGEYGADGYI